MSSQVSCCSSIPDELLAVNDSYFHDELETVNELYFNHSDIDADDLVQSDSFDVLCSAEIDDNGDDENVADVNTNVELDDEQLRQHNFSVNGCGCTRLYGESCSKVVSWDSLISYRLSCLEKSKDELDLIVKVQLFHHRNCGPVTVGKKRKTKDREKTRQSYYFGGRLVCRDLFAFAHGISRKTVDALGRSLDLNGLEPRVHGNVRKVPKHSLTLIDVENVKLFLNNYATQNGLPLPGRTPHYNEKHILLPSDRNKCDIYQLYSRAADEGNCRKISISAFYKIWNDQCPYLFVMKPATDLCLKCQSHVNIISKSGNFTEEEKADKIQDYQTHIQRVKCQRDYYRSQAESSRTAFQQLPPENRIRGQQPGTTDAVHHYSFDYAQQVFYPHQAQQVGPLYFRTPRKCQCFGVCSESAGTQIFYLVDEQYQTVGKGANSVTSMLDHHFKYHGFGERHVVMHMDNCSGQNKNNTVISYGAWRIITNQHQTLEFSMMEAGHTKFSPDWHFGLWKVRWRHSTVSTLEDIARTVSDSSRNGHNIPQLVADEDKPVIFHDWRSFCRKLFRPVPNLLSYHHFRMTSDKPGVVFARKYADEPEVEVRILRDGVNLDSISDYQPARLPMPGLDPKRMWYLYEEIGPLCKNSDSSCPKPNVPKPKLTVSSYSKVDKR